MPTDSSRLWSTITGWLNLGGVTVRLRKVSQPLRRTDLVVTGSVLLESKSNQTVLSLEIKVIEEIKKVEGTGENKVTKTKTTVLGSTKFPKSKKSGGYPLELTPQFDQEQAFTVEVEPSPRLEHYGSPIGSIPTITAFDMDVTVIYSIVATARVRGSAVQPFDKRSLTIAD